MSSIALIMPYFGEWPVWADLFFLSCRYNSSIDFLFFTDREPPASAIGADNIHFRKMSFVEYCDFASSVLNIDFHPTKAYKLCDLRPFYGYIHRQDLKGYDFWGYGDVDLIWGDIRKFYTEEVLRKYDVLSTHADRMSGHLMIIRNAEKYTNLPFKYRRWRELLTSENNVAFDEHHFTLLLHPFALLLWKTRKLVFLRFRFNNDWKAYNSFCMRINQLLGLNRRRILFVERETTPWAGGYQLMKSWKYFNGKITDIQTGEELIYLHFFSMKKVWCGNYYHPSSNGVIINFNGIYPLE